MAATKTPSGSEAPSASRSAARGSGGTADGGQAGSADATTAALPSETIREVQQELADKGHDPGPVDGIVGPQTRQAAKSFQKAQGIEPTGELDAKTLSALDVAADK